MGVAPSATDHRLLVQHSPEMIWRSGLDALCAQNPQQPDNRVQLALAQNFEQWILAIVSHDTVIR